VASLSRHKSNLEEEISMQKGKIETIQKELGAQKELNDIAENTITSLKSELEALKKLLEKERAINNNLLKELDSEKKEREKDNETNRNKIEKLFNQAKLDLKAKEVVIKRLEQSNAELVTKLNEETEKSKITIHELDRNYRSISKKLLTVEEEFKLVKTRADTMTEKSKTLEAEKIKLTQTALSLQESKRKLKSLCDRYPKLEDLAKLIFGDLSFSYIIKECSKHGLVQKQGGNHVNRWQIRHLVVNDNFLLYYATPSDKLPKGLSRIDGEHLVDVSKCDLSNLKKENGFTVVVRENPKDPKSYRSFFFSAATEHDCFEWIQYIKQAQELQTYI